MPIDLTGKSTPLSPPAAEKPAPPSRPGTKPASPPRKTVEESIGSRLERAIIRISDVLENRGNIELSEALREDAKSMSGAVLSATRRFTPLGKTVLFLLDIAEPILAFGRVVRIAFTQFREWRNPPDDDEISRNGDSPAS